MKSVKVLPCTLSFYVLMDMPNFFAHTLAQAHPTNVLHHLVIFVSNATECKHISCGHGTAMSVCLSTCISSLLLEVKAWERGWSII